MHNTFYLLHRYDEALADYKQAIRLDPKLVSAYENMSLALRRLGRYQEAQQAYEKARRLQARNRRLC